MKITDFAALFEHEVLECPEELVRSTVARTLMDFCERTSAWSQTQDPIDLVDGVSDYEVDVPLGLQVVDVISVHDASGAPLTAVSMSALEQVLPDWRVAESNRPVYYNSPNEWGVVTVYPRPSGSTGESIVIRAAFKPKLTATTVPDEIANRYADTIISGVLARLMKPSTSRWANPARSKDEEEKYENGVLKALVETKRKARVSGSQFVQPKAFG